MKEAFDLLRLNRLSEASALELETGPIGCDAWCNATAHIIQEFRDGHRKGKLSKAPPEIKKIAAELVAHCGHWMVFDLTPKQLRKLADCMEMWGEPPMGNPHLSLLVAYKGALTQSDSSFRRFGLFDPARPKSPPEAVEFWLSGPAVLRKQKIKSPPTLAQVRAEFVRLFGDGTWENGKAEDRRTQDRVNARIIRKTFKLPLAPDSNRRPG